MAHKLDLVAIKKNDVYYVRDRDKYPSTFDDDRLNNLDTDEAAAVVFHMGCWTAGIASDYPLGQSFNTAVDRYPLVVLLSTADWLSSRLFEERT